MKRSRIFLILLAASMSLGIPTSLNQPLRTTVLFDEYHSTLGIADRLNLLSSMLKGSNYDVSFNYREVTPDLLQDVDIYVVALPTAKFKEMEKAALTNFVAKGGGLLLIGESESFMEDYGILSPMNDVSSSFGIRFSPDVIVDESRNLTFGVIPVPEIPIISDMVSHPVTVGIKEFFLQYGCSLLVSPPAIAIAFASGAAYGDRNNNEKKDADENGAVVALAASEYGDGRVVAIGDSHLWGSREASSLPFTKDQIDYLDNRKLAKNIFFWLASKPYIRSVVGSIGEAQKLLADGNYIEAKGRLTTALSILARIGSTQYLSEINELLEKSEEGIRADNLMTSGEKALGEKRYSDARTDFVSARDIYGHIGSERKDKAQERIDFIDRISEKDKRRSEADSLFEKGLNDFNKGNCKDAQEYFRQAKAIYAEIRDTEKANLCTDYIQKCEKEETGFSHTGFIIVLVLIVFLRIHSHS